MDICDDILEENDRYAFLLGSALRNKEEDKFLEIYDKVIPKDLNEKELEEIKERARQLASASEAEFGEIAARARQYSLAQPGLYAPCDMLDASDDTAEVGKIECMRANVSSVSSGPDLSSDFYPPPMDRPGLTSLQRTSRHFSTPRTSEASEFSVSDASDSGICLNTSKRGGSASDQDEYERRGVFDYYIQGCKDSSMKPRIDIDTVSYNGVVSSPASVAPSNTGRGRVSGGHITVHDAGLLQQHWDEEVVAMESPGSEEGESRGEVEMVTLSKRSVSPDPETISLLHPLERKCQRREVRHLNNQVYDESFAVEERSLSSGDSSSSSASSGEELQQIIVKSPDSDVDISNVNVHRQLYDRHDPHDPHFTPMTREFSERYEEPDDDDPARALQRLSDQIGGARSNTYEREVKFRSAKDYSAMRSYGALNRDTRPVDRGVNFGLGSPSSSSSLSSGVRLERNVSAKLGSGPHHHQPPFGDPLKFERVGHSSSRLLKPDRIGPEDTRNMPDAEVIRPEGKRRKRRKKKEESDENGNPLEEGRAGSISKQVEPYRSEGRCLGESNFPSRLESLEGINAQHNDTMKFQEKKARKNKKKEQEDKGVIKAEKIPGHRGHDEVDALLNFIEGDKGNNRKQLPQSHKTSRLQFSPQQVTQPAPLVVNQSTNHNLQSPQFAENGLVVGESRVADVAADPVRQAVTEQQDPGHVTSSSQTRRDGKKKKRGSSSGSVSKENSVEARDTGSENGSVSDLKETSVTMATQSVEPGREIVENGQTFLPEERYIFTDFESQKPKPREDEFQTVSNRKKKKQPQKEVDMNIRGGGFVNGFSNSGFNSGNNSSNASDSVNNRKLNNKANEFVNNFRQRQQNYNNLKYNGANSTTNGPWSGGSEKRSYTPPPTPTSVVDTKPHSRAFSPSAFPALAKKAGVGLVPVSSGGRRNSTGNAIELEAEKEDSDLESCKSVPASKPPAGVDPLPKVSYAKVLGGSPLEEGGGETPERERRHSLGNLPMPQPGQLEASMKQGVARSQEMADHSNPLSSGLSSLSSTSKASSLANSKYSSTENLNPPTGGGGRETSPVSDPATLNPSSDTDFPPMPAANMASNSQPSSTSQHLPESSTKHISSSSSLSSSYSTCSPLDSSHNRWSQPPPILSQHSSHSNSASTTSSKTNTVAPQSETKAPQKADPTLSRGKVSSAPASSNSSSGGGGGGGAGTSDKVTTKPQPSDNRKQSAPTVLHSSSNVNSGKQHTAKTRTNTAQIASANTTKTQVTNSNTTNRKASLNSNQPSSSSSGVSSNSKSNPLKTATTQSVIFLDRKFSEEANRFEISFGFEPTLEVSSTDCVEGDVVISEATVPPPPAQTTLVQPTYVIVPDSNPSKQQALSSPPNGIVMAPPIGLKTVPSGIRPLPAPTTTSGGQAGGKDTHKLPTSVQEVKDMQSEDTCVGVEFGGEEASEVTEVTYTLPTLPSRDLDPNYQRGKFDQEKVVNYIYNEWCNVMSEGDKVRDSVMVYGRDLS